MKKALLVRFGIVLLGLAAGLPAEVRLPKYTRMQLPNGAVLIVMPRPGIPLVQFRLVVKGGGEADPADQAGLASITAQALRKGAAKRSSDEFSNEIDSLGGAFNAFANDESTVIAAEFLRKDFDRGLSLFSDAALHPTFPEDEIKKLISQSTDRVRSAKDAPGQAIGYYFRGFFYGPQHPYGRISDEAALARITRASVANYHKQQYVGRNMILVVAGDFDPATAGPALAKVFGSVPAGAAFVWPTAVKPLPGARLLLVDKPDATQTYFEIAQPGIRRTDPDRTGVDLLNTLFGGRFTSLLNDALRVNSGLTYGARSIVTEEVHPGAISISTYTRTDTTEKAMDMALDVLKRFHDNGISAEQLASAKAYVKGTFPPRFLETSDALSGVVSDMELYGLNKGEVDDLFSRIDALTLEQANAMAKKHFAATQLTFVVLGNAAKIRDVVKKYAPSVTEVSIATPGFSASEAAAGSTAR